MIILDKKSYKLVEHLLTLEEPETVMTISKKLNQSRRKIYYHLDKINEALPETVEKVVSYPRIGIVLNDGQKNAFHSFLEQLDDYSYIMSVEERIELTLIYIAISKERVTIEKLMQLSMVSRNTILNDLNSIRLQLTESGRDIQLHVTKAKGYYLDCHPLSKIQFIYQLLYKMITHRTDSFLQLLREKIIELTESTELFSQEVNEFIYKQLSSAQEILGKRINYQDVQFMVATFPYLLSSYRNIDLVSSEQILLQEELEQTKQRREYELAVILSEGLLKECHISLDDNEISIIAMFLLSVRKDLDFHLESADYVSMRQTITMFIDAIARYYDINFDHEEDLTNQLLTHCKALRYRKIYGISSVNPLTNDIKCQYSELFDVTKSFVFVLEDAWDITLNDDDVAYIAIHLGGELRRKKSITTQKKNVVLVCDEGVGVQKLLMRQCKEYLKNAQIKAVFTIEQFYSVVDIMMTDMVISTNDSLESPFPMLVVNPIMSEDDIIKLIRFSNNRGKEGDIQFSQKLENCLKNYIADDKERYALKIQLEKIVSQELLDGSNL